MNEPDEETKVEIQDEADEELGKASDTAGAEKANSDNEEEKIQQSATGAPGETPLVVEDVVDESPSPPPAKNEGVDDEEMEATIDEDIAATDDDVETGKISDAAAVMAPDEGKIQSAPVAPGEEKTEEVVTEADKLLEVAEKDEEGAGAEEANKNQIVEQSQGEEEAPPDQQRRQCLKILIIAFGIAIIALVIAMIIVAVSDGGSSSTDINSADSGTGEDSSDVDGTSSSPSPTPTGSPFLDDTGKISLFNTTLIQMTENFLW
jgi:hypothetical protein